MSIHHRLYLILAFIISYNFVTAQRFYKNTPALGIIKVNVGTGLSYYLGDMRASTDMRFIEPHIAIGVKYGLLPRVSFRGELDFYRIAGSQVGTPNWYNNLSFRSDNPAVYVGLQAEAFSYDDFRKFRPYAFGGIGITRINPKANYQGIWYSLPPLMTEGVTYNRNVRIFVAGIGVNYKLNDTWGVALELSQNFGNSDYLDDVSTVYPDPAGMSELSIKLSDRRPELDPNSLPANYPTQNLPGNQRGNARSKDAYGFLSFRIEYLLTTRAKQIEKRKLKCYY